MRRICEFFNKLAGRNKKKPGEKVITMTLHDDRVEFSVRGRKHRDDGPAVVWKDGTKEWWFNGLRHRDGAPAIERSCGCKAWYTYGTLTEAEGEDGVRVYPSGHFIPRDKKRCKFSNGH